MTHDAQMIPAWQNGQLQAIEKLLVHQLGLRHKAVSVFILDDHGRILLQQRAAGKYHTPGLWANTCCTHPHWDEPPEHTAHRRLDQELGITNVSLFHKGQLEYRAEVGSGLIEHELVDVFAGHMPQAQVFAANPDEVQNTRWISPQDLTEQIATTPLIFTPWLRIYMRDHAAMIFETP